MNKNIIAVWQPIGFSTHIIAKKYSETTNYKTAHTGTLDPMAEGIIILLVDKEIKNKKKFSKWRKKYTFEICLSIETDTLDAMGMIKNISLKDDFNIEKFKKFIDNLPSKINLQYPIFSNKKLKGKYLYEYYLNNLEIPTNLPSRESEIYNIELVDFYKINPTEYTNEIISNIKKVSGDFRQEKIINQWKNFTTPTELNIVKISAEVSSGTYIRSLSQYILNNLGLIGFTNKITRLQNGIFTKKQALTLEELFKNSYKNLDFISKTKIRVL